MKIPGYNPKAKTPRSVWITLAALVLVGYCTVKLTQSSMEQERTRERNEELARDARVHIERACRRYLPDEGRTLTCIGVEMQRWADSMDAAKRAAKPNSN